MRIRAMIGLAATMAIGGASTGLRAQTAPAVPIPQSTVPTLPAPTTAPSAPARSIAAPSGPAIIPTGTLVAQPTVTLVMNSNQALDVDTGTVAPQSPASDLRVVAAYGRIDFVPMNGAITTGTSASPAPDQLYAICKGVRGYVNAQPYSSTLKRLCMTTPGGRVVAIDIVQVQTGQAPPSVTLKVYIFAA